ncbi:Co2+/Mg2+ efflux protein ApaG [Deinococcus aquaedulcis]|uniref:Co2+/Mg2+ efflux protein ApaG n=1 Tax=Deinococcus aquaedulcis TaxID=2840455 RepID=UPI001C829277|nr:Co2+/Mg2+ efflux protein ApaG [Deinococcus aquaedulcis]
MTPPQPPELPEIEVQVDPQHLPSHSTPERQVFAYVVRIENRSDQTWKLLARHWEIVDARGRTVTVDGEGVVGEQPILPPGGVFVYDSFVTLDAAPGRMGGHYLMQGAWGEQVRVPIAPFRLAAPGETLLN